MSVLTILQRNVKWRFHNSFTIVVTILQPILWLVLHSAVASQTMQGTGISNYYRFYFARPYCVKAVSPNERISSQTSSSNFPAMP